MFSLPHHNQSTRFGWQADLHLSLSTASAARLLTNRGLHSAWSDFADAVTRQAKCSLKLSLVSQPSWLAWYVCTLRERSVLIAF